MGSHCTHHSQFPPMITISTALFACLGLQAAVASPLSQFAETLNTENLEMEVAALKHSMTTLLSAQSVANSMVCTDITGTVSVTNHQVHHIPAMYEGAPPPLPGTQTVWQAADLKSEDGTTIGVSSGSCVQLSPATVWNLYGKYINCIVTLSFTEDSSYDIGSLMLQGEYDASMTTTSNLAVTGGTGGYAQASGSSTLSFNQGEGAWDYALSGIKCSTSSTH